MGPDKAVIVGAGVAGLTAAMDLLAANVDVTVLEARPRVGGRVHTVSLPDGRWANAGADWVKAEHHLVRGMAAAFGLKMVAAREFEAYVVDGRLHPTKPRSAHLISEALEDLAEPIIRMDRPWSDRTAMELDRRSVAEWLDDLRPADEARAWFEARIRAEYMVEPDELSLVVLSMAGRLGSRSTSYRFADGAGSFVDALVQRCEGAAIHLGEPVRRIEHDASGAAAVTDDATYEADDVIVTAPLPALARVTFDPEIELPVIGQGRGGKLLVPYPAPGWRHPELDVTEEVSFDLVYENAPDQRARGGILGVYGMQRIDAEEAIRAFAAWFPELGDPDGEPMGVWWDTEPESGCTASAFRPGDVKALQRLASRTGHVHFAGEYAEPMSGYIDSALRSGRRVVNRMLGKMSKF
ncbi:FAD-dependent oxidoreductase [Actinobacteria bacterium YIM 96077]|uniref:FAD-dependent oxidoreductase n=1 Tax=Phytoactinopolyspora halophila TaxID=1981511 RepID=A0A329QI60_9ACTN|nr:NAD(P)/FAD-dependent oxidoreductase [Phytoactinopolyspora halophila]AYY12407.1 FAD-dependent oxidoreductase [Actinobacteria bacterium YIM 96077]RAW12014.1 FAD-dependent oxidoreductase [Phytoactinopolyspora halophila]